jgi:hypothetical protein
MAPEQILGGPTGPTTDVYALGVLIYRTLCGRHPFPARSVSEMEQMHLHRSVTRPGEIAPALSWLDGVVLRCLDKEPGRRYPSVTELLQDLRAAGARPALQTDTVPALALEVRLGDSSAARRRELRGACEAHGLVVAVEDPGFFLAVTVLPDGADAAAARARLEALAEHLATAVDVSVTLHAAPARVLVVDGVTQVVGGELLAVVSG